MVLVMTPKGQPQLETKGKRSQKLYIMGLSGVDLIYKIGISVNPKRRLKQLQTGCPFILRLLWCCDLKDAKETEKRIHLCLKSNHVSGEWYKVEGDVISVVKSLVTTTKGDDWLLRYKSKLPNTPSINPIILPRGQKAPYEGVMHSMIGVMQSQLKTMQRMMQSMIQ